MDYTEGIKKSFAKIRKSGYMLQAEVNSFDVFILVEIMLGILSIPAYAGIIVILKIHH
ncbi:MAG: hypothetical protein K0R14_1178 [Burkholderiales bacterium]|jgi:hypothetical protein|nr:hypothetical protein [Burkholderiales bacterium]